ncbi:hypothetical protein [Brevibacillus invocatus]|uniref:hypothetical protein n=1 Tax=Brevibacillus invocatus TaxID=173959 RepID=UPI00203A74D8|nr:hypothetical protein [Brevibacillus invocatus]MCM3080562.1 hypothetical protein [Brevibacillus invocatus]MCM3430675.1 hypothetical protein [Brevibacillus invocatus]
MLKKSLLFGVVLVVGITSYTYTTSFAQQPATSVAVEKSATEEAVLLERLQMLENAIVPTTAEATVDMWAKAVQERNGALQYALLTENAKLGSKRSFESFHWVTGASSPWVENYTITSLPANEEQPQEQRFQVEFELVTSTGKTGKDQAFVGVVKQGQKWLIQSFGPVSEKAVGIWNTPESINEQSIENNFEDMKKVESNLGYTIQLPQNVLQKIKIEESSCKNEEGNPPCLNFFYKDMVTKQDVILASVIRLSKEQEKSDYYAGHPFLKKIGENHQGAFYSIIPSEHQYAGKEESVQGKEWSQLMEMLQVRMSKSI